MVLAIEPMTTAGRPAVRAGGDGWAIFSQDSSPTAHFEFTVAITADGPRILTPWHDSSERGGSSEGWPGQADSRLAEPVSQGAAGGR
jgi:methionyl aminopeptidase